MITHQTALKSEYSTQYECNEKYINTQRFIHTGTSKIA